MHNKWCLVWSWRANQCVLRLGCAGGPASGGQPIASASRRPGERRWTSSEEVSLSAATHREDGHCRQREAREAVLWSCRDKNKGLLYKAAATRTKPSVKLLRQEYSPEARLPLQEQSSRVKLPQDQSPSAKPTKQEQSPRAKPPRQEQSSRATRQ